MTISGRNAAFFYWGLALCGIIFIFGVQPGIECIGITVVGIMFLIWYGIRVWKRNPW